jgi:LmbE family N-acetylglucosaminyl deacetylase
MAMGLIVDDLHPGTDEGRWLSAGRLASLPPLPEARPARLVVVAPHPDDEVLGAGGLLQHMRAAGVEILVVAVTDGEASHPGARALGYDLAALRAVETRVALDRLGCGAVHVERLGLTDGAVAEEVELLSDRLTRLLKPDDLCLVPWREDGHRDHEAVGRVGVAAAGAIRTPVLEYLVWAWHWARPDTGDLPWRQCRRLDLGRRDTARKRWAIHAFTSQIRPLGSEHSGRPLLPAAVLRRFWRPFEVFIEPAQ